MDKLLRAYSRALEWVLVLLLGLMVVLVFGNVVMRYAFDSGITVSEEVARWLFVWMTFLGAIVALGENGHLGTDMLVSRFGAVGKRVCLGVTQVLMLGITWLMLTGAWQQVQINWEVEAPITGASMAIFYAAGVVFALSSGVMLLVQLGRTLSGRVSERDLVMVQESEDLAQVEELHLDQSQTFKKH
jgi:TRAP-type C4-dicarboxylate transport system permease small subunit